MRVPANTASHHPARPVDPGRQDGQGHADGPQARLSQSLSRSPQPRSSRWSASSSRWCSWRCSSASTSAPRTASPPCSTTPRATCGWSRSAPRASTILPCSPVASATRCSRRRVWPSVEELARRLRQLAQAEGRLDRGAAGRLRNQPRQLAAVGRHARQHHRTGRAVGGGDRQHLLQRARHQASWATAPRSTTWRSPSTP